MSAANEIEIRPALPSDAEEVLALNHRWQKSNLGDQLDQGYLSLALDHEVLNLLIENQTIAIAVDEGEIIGYVLSNNYSKIIEQYSGKQVKRLKETGEIDPKLNVALGAQVVIEPAYRKKGLRRLMLRKLLESITSTYDLLFTSVMQENEWILQMDLRDGWELVSKDEKHYYITLDIAKWLVNNPL